MRCLDRRMTSSYILGQEGLPSQEKIQRGTATKEAFFFTAVFYRITKHLKNDGVPFFNFFIVPLKVSVCTTT